jgi:uncharacterized phiE125 gp8 family phage protein
MAFNRIITPPTTLPITLADLKDHLAISNSDSDDRLERYILAASSYCERWTNRVFMMQTWEHVLPWFPFHGVELPKPPLTNVVSVTYIDLNGEPQPFTNFRAMYPTGSTPGWIEYTGALPPTSSQSDAVVIRFVCGEASAPSDMQHAVRLLCGGWNENREAEILTTSKELEIGVARLLAPLCVGNYL